MSIRVLTVCAFLMAVGCGGGDSTSDKLSDLERTFEAQAATTCECFAELQFGSEQECLDEFGGALTATERSCVLDAFALDSAASDTYLDCLLAADQDYLDCIDRDLDCNDFSTAEACADAYDAATELCTLPEAVSSEFAACFPQ